MYIEGKDPLFHKHHNRSNPYRVMILLVLIAVMVSILRGYAKGDIEPLFLPTATPTRTINSYVIEANTHFLAGNLEKSIEAYKKAVETDPTNPNLFTELARVQVYSSNTLTTDAERRQRLAEALEAINQAKALAPTDSSVLAVRAFVLNWNAEETLAGDKSESLRNEAEAEALMALQLDNTNTLALAYYSEILIDQFKWVQAREYMAQAMERGPDLMDVHRIQAYLYEILGEYNLAIQEYQKAIEITPNLTFLYNSVGRLYRHLATTLGEGPVSDEYYDLALEYFDKAASLNEQLGIKDPIPYMLIANTYIRMGEAMVASRNAYKALTFNPYSPDVYGQVGLIYYRARNYEGSIPALKCAVEGCTAEESCSVRECDPETDEVFAIEGLPLSESTVVYYYTYGSVLAGLHRSGDDNCTLAMDVFAEIEATYREDETIMGIVQSGKDICQLEE
jgi:tetratricopeptide (TPR) repeat protein